MPQSPGPGSTAFSSRKPFQVFKLSFNFLWTPEPTLRAMLHKFCSKFSLLFLPSTDFFRTRELNERVLCRTTVDQKVHNPLPSTESSTAVKLGLSRSMKDPHSYRSLSLFLPNYLVSGIGKWTIFSAPQHHPLNKVPFLALHFLYHIVHALCPATRCETQGRRCCPPWLVV